MRGIRQLFSWRGIRSWLSERIGILLVAIASAYNVAHPHTGISLISSRRQK